MFTYRLIAFMLNHCSTLRSRLSRCSLASARGKVASPPHLCLKRTEIYYQNLLDSQWKLTFEQQNFVVRVRTLLSQRMQQDLG